MKKRILSILLAALMLVSLLPTVALADEHVHNFDEETRLCECGAANYTLVLTSDGKAYRDEAEDGNEINLSDTLFSDKLSFSNDVWTMTNFTFTTTAETAVVFAGNTVLNLEDKSTNTITSTYEGESSSYGIYANGTLTIQGGGTVSATGGISTYNKSYGVYVSGDMTVSGGTVEATGGTAYDYCSYGIYVDNSGNLTVSGGSVTAKGGMTNKEKYYCYSYGIRVAGGMEVSGGTVTATGDAGYNSYGVYVSSGGMEVSGGSVTAKAGTADYYSYGVYVSSGGMEVSGGSVEATGGTSMGSDSYGIRVAGGMEVSGGSVEATGGAAYANSIGVYVSGDMTVSGGSVTVGDAKYGIYVSGNMNIFGGDITVNNCSWDVCFFGKYNFGESGYANSAVGKYMSYTGVLTELGKANLHYDLFTDVHGFYGSNKNELLTTYGNQGYVIETDGLDNATVTPGAELVYGGHYVLLSYTVEAKEEIENGKLGIWADVMIGDNDEAPVEVVKEGENKKVVGFTLTDNHGEAWIDNYGNPCANLNAQYKCYFDGKYLKDAVGGGFQPANTYWFGLYSGADDHVFDLLSEETAFDGKGKVNYLPNFTGLNDTDSGMAVSWLINQDAGETKTYYVLMGIGDSSMNEAPVFSEAPEKPSVDDDTGLVTATVTNETSDVSNAGNIDLSAITSTGKEWTVCGKPLTGGTSPLTATFTDEQINARPGTYLIEKLRATNKGGLFTDYVLKGDQGQAQPVEVTITLSKRTTTLNLAPEGGEVEPSKLAEGWEWNGEKNKLSLFGMQQQVGEDNGIELPDDATIDVEKEGANITVEGEETAALSGAGDMVLTGEGKLTLDAPTGIETAGNVSLGGDVTITASECGISCGELKIDDGATLTINLTDLGCIAFGLGTKITIPKGYEVIGGTIDGAGNFNLADGATQVIIRKKAPVYSGGDYTPTITVPVSGDGNKVNVSASVSGNTATVKAITDAELDKVTGGEAVEIDLSGLGKNVDTAKIPTTTVEKIAEQSGMSVKLSTATVTFDKAATQEISAQAGGNTIQLVVDDIKEVSLNAVQKEAVKKLDTALIIDAYLVSNGTRLCSESKGGFNGGKATVALPFEIKNNRTSANYSVYYVDDGGNLEKLNAKYDSKLGAFVFDITHFSNYVVAYDENAALAFTDVPVDQYFYNAVKWAAANGITEGTSATTFSPYVPVTRAQVVTFLWRAAGCPVVNYAMNMSDVKSGEYYSEAVRWALSEGITKGTTDTTFSPDMVCTRGQIVTFLARFAGVKDADTVSVFSDVPANEFFAAAVKWAKDNGVTSGVTATTFEPYTNCNRAQVVTFLYRWMVK